MTTQLPVAIPHPRFAQAMRVLFPNAQPRLDFVLEDQGDANGPQITQWSLPGDPPTLAQITTALQQFDWAVLRAQRDARLAASQWLVDRHRDQVALNMATSLTALQFATLLTWRQQLRDFPAANLGVDANSLSLPTLPAGIASIQAAGT